MRCLTGLMLFCCRYRMVCTPVEDMSEKTKSIVYWFLTLAIILLPLASCPDSIIEIFLLNGVSKAYHVYAVAIENKENPIS